MDRILQAEGDSPNDYKASKQADVIMLFYLFSPLEVIRLFKQLNYSMSEQIIKDNIDYYVQRTSHGSTLSKAILAYVYTYFDMEKSMSYFEQALSVDFTFTEDTTTHEGIHLGAMALCVNILKQCFMGIRITNRKLHFKPNLPPLIKKLKCNLIFRNRHFIFTVTDKKLTIELLNDTKRGLLVVIYDVNYYLKPGQILTI